MGQSLSQQGSTSVTDQPGRYYRLVTQEEQKLYDHLLSVVQTESADQVLDRIRNLIIEGTSYPDRDITRSLDQIVLTESSAQEFQFILNRCCHILTNRWQGRPTTQYAIPQLISILESSPAKPTDFTRSKANRQLRELVQQFQGTDQFSALRRLSRVLEQQNIVPEPENQPLGTLIRRYPYLYPHCLVTEGSSVEDQQSVRTLQTSMQHRYELDLSQFVTYQVRRSARSLQSQAARTHYAVPNPTFLDEPQLCAALKQFTGKVRNGCTHKDLANRFLVHNTDQKSFGHFKDDLYEYLIDAVDPEYGRRQFNNQLYQQLRVILPDNDRSDFNEFLLLRTCSQLLNFLIVQSPNQPNHFVFVDMLSNLGAINTTSLLLKLVLLCRKVKPYLEKRFSILFNHYESHTQNSVHWLVMAMEHLNIALSTNFGGMNLALVNSLN